MKLTVIRPSHAHSAYRIAAETFIELAKKVGGAECVLITDLESLPDDGSPVIVIGTDAVNHFTANAYFSRQIDDFGIRYGTDNYRILSTDVNGRRMVFFAAGRPRAAIYAVYRYFEVFCGCRYFWDGDRLRETALPLSGIDLYESPRFEYRGLRYFAHRSLHRFQAEHWSLPDWEHEIDWILKKRLNMFMLRIGIDDLFQRAFPDIVSYPDRDKPLPEAGGGYDDRTLFWSLEYRGELRKELLAYAFERDLMHPEDCGTMTHWYSRTPVEFLERVKPELLSQKSSGYREQTGLVWDIRKDENLDNYFRLTDTYVREYGKPELFHTIGLAERNYSDDREENMRLKLNVYRRIAAHLAEKYPNAKLFIASWDLWMFYKPEEVQRLVAELDPNQSIILDYTSDTARQSNFTNWGVVGKFPWIFGIFSGYEPNSEFRGYYELTNERLKLAKSDRMCKGLILWPELSHGDTLITEYLARNAWDEETLHIPELVERYCEDRYPETQTALMKEIWHEFMPIVEIRAWSSYRTQGYDQSDNDIFTIVINRAQFCGDPTRFDSRLESAGELKASAAKILRALAGITTDDEMQRRDIYDISRTVLGRFVDFGIMRAQKLFLTGHDPSEAMELTLRLNRILAGVLAGHEDFSLWKTLCRLREVTDTNPDFEVTLKHNAENGYCRSYIFENAEYLYVPEMEILFDEVRSGGGIDWERVKTRAEENRRLYYSTPLCEMNRIERRPLSVLLTKAAAIIEDFDY